jgi:hypothetical protein
LDWYDSKKKKDDYESFQIKESVQQLQQVTKDIFGISKISQKRGELGENMIYNILQNDYQNYTCEKTNHIPHSGDGIVTTPNNDKFLLEIKNYQNVVDKREIDKLKNDMESTDIRYALFISIQSGIVGKKTIDIEMFTKNDKDYIIVYSSYIFDETHKLHSSITLLESLMKVKSNNYNHLKDDIIETVKEITDIYDSIKNLNSQYLILENIVKDQLSNFYIIIRDSQIQIKEKINKISKKIENSIYISSEDFLSKFNENEYNYQINKIYDLIITNNMSILNKDDSLWFIVNKNDNIGEIKKYKTKIEIVLYNPNICIKFTAKDKSDDNYTLLNNIIKQFYI